MGHALTRVRRVASGLVARGRLERELSEEMAHHLELEIADRIRAGADPAEARRTALRDFGGVERWKEEARAARGLGGWDTLRQDLRYTLRTLGGRPGWSAAAIVTLGVGIGATTAIYSFVQGVLLQPLPYPDPDRLVAVEQVDVETGEGLEVFTYPWYEAWLTAQDVLPELGAYAQSGLTLQLDEGAERVQGAVMTSQVLDVLRIRPIRGRRFLPEDDVPGAEPVILVSFETWQTRFGGRDDIVGTSVTLDGTPRLVVGVMPQGFAFPDTAIEFWLPFATAYRGEGTAYLRAVSRLPERVTLEAARAGLARSTRTEVREGGSLEIRLSIDPLKDAVVGDAGGGLIMFLGAVAVLLLVATLNVANLLLLRAVERGRELGVRAALGASRRRLVRLHMTEGLVLAAVAGLLGTALSVWLVDGLRLLVVDRLPRAHEIHVNRVVLGFSMVVALGTGLVVGVAPAIRSGWDDLAQRLRSGAAAVTVERRGTRLRAGLVVGQLVLATVLLFGGGLMVRSFMVLGRVSSGFDVDGVATISIDAPSARYPDFEARRRLYGELTQRLAARPEVRAAGLVSFLPFSPFRSVYDIEVEGRTAPGATGSVELLVVSPSYFDVMGVALREGRLPTDTDRDASLPVVVVNESLARARWPGGDAVGSRIRLEGETWWTVAGVVADTRQHGLDTDPVDQVYLPYAQAADKWQFGMSILARTDGGLDRGAMARLARTVVATVDRSIPVASVRMLDDYRADSVAEPRLRALVVGLFAAVALLLAAIGVYGVIGQMAAASTRETGIRMALGATRGRVVGRLVRRGALLAGTGLGIGMVAALALGQVLKSYLFGITARDSATLVVIAALLGGAALVASYVPARRAARLDPVRALKSE